jgi:hypothetical protein
MRIWQVAILMNLALAVGLGIGYGAWGHRLGVVASEIKSAQAQVEQLTREREACFAVRPPRQAALGGARGRAGGLS